MKMREARKGLRVALSERAFKLREESLIVRRFGTLTSGRILASKPPYEEGLFLRVKWDGLTTPENWNLADLRMAKDPPETTQGETE